MTVARTELNLQQLAQVAVAREALAAIDTVKLTDAAQGAHMVGRLGASLKSLLAIIDGEDQAARRCLAAHPEDPTPCDGPVVVTILDRHNAGADGCEHHGARMLASLEGAYAISLPDHYGAAVRVTKAADAIRPFPWLTDAPRTRPQQLSRAENRRRGEAQ